MKINVKFMNKIKFLFRLDWPLFKPATGLILEPAIIIFTDIGEPASVQERDNE